MTYKQFLMLCKSTDAYIKGKDGKEYVDITWDMGGQSGGSCWSTPDNPSQFYARDGEPEPEFADLDIILEKLAPRVSFLQYKGICRLVKRDSWRDDDWYGNYTLKGSKKIELNTLYNYLKDHDLLVMPPAPEPDWR